MNTKITTYLSEYPDYLYGAQNATRNTVKDYTYDANRYIGYFRDNVDQSLETFDITPKHLRNYAIYLRRTLKNDEATVERRLHGISAFWLFLHNQHDFPAPVSLKVCGIRVRKTRKPTKPLRSENYTSILEVIENGLSKIK